MAGEIGSAFVRIRPNMEGFKSETEGGVKSAFSGIAKIAAVAFGAVEAFKLGKDVVQGAAELQKSVEVINSQFGQAGERVKQFGEDAAGKFGLSAQAADATSARFGILFNNLGIGKQKAADMTIGFQELTGSLAAVRGVDPTDVLNSIVQAAAGNTRGLKQLGIVIDSTMIKQEALKLGLISSIKDAITPATKAQAIYALATQNLGALQQQAGLHSKDLIDTQRRLSAEWSNAKDTLGTVLLPVVEKVTNVLADVLPKAIDFTTKAIDKGINMIKKLVAPLRPVFDELVRGAQQIVQAYEKGGLVAAIDKAKTVFQGLSGPAKIVAEALAAITTALAASAATGAFSAITGAVTSIVTAGGPLAMFVVGLVAAAEGFQYLYKNSAQFRDIVDQITGFLTATVVPVFEQLWGVLKDIAAVISGGGGVSGAIDKIRSDFANLSTGAKVTAIAITGVAAALIGVQLAAAPVAGAVIGVIALGAAFAYAYEHSQTFRDKIAEVKTFIVSSVIPVFKTLVAEARSDMEGLVQTFSSRWDQIKTIFNAAVAVLRALWSTFGGFIQREMQVTFTATLSIISSVLRIIEGIIGLFIDVLTGKWGKAWGDVKQITLGVINTMIGMIKLLLGGFLLWIEKAALKIALALAEPFSHLPGNLGAWARNLKDDINAKLDSINASASHSAWLIGFSIGSNLADGVNASKANWLSSITNASKRSLQEAKDKSAKPAKDVGTSIATNITTAIGAGLGGSSGGGGGGSSKVSDAVQKALDAAKAKVQAGRDAVSSAFQNLGASAIKAFEAGTSAELSKMQTQFNAEIKKKVTDPMNAALARLAAENKAALTQLDAQQSAQTPAEKALADLTAAHDEAARQKAITDAQAQKATDVASGTADAATLVADQRAIDDALYTEQVANLQKTAAAERAALDKSIASKREAINQQYADDQDGIKSAYEQLQTALQAQYDTRVLNYQSLRDLQETHLKATLDSLGKSLALHPAEWQKTHDTIMKLFKTSFGPDYEKVGKNMGVGFAKGLEESFATVKKTVTKLAQLLADFIPHSPAKMGPLSKPPNWVGFLTHGLNPGLVSDAFSNALGIPGGMRASAGGLGSALGSLEGTHRSIAASEQKQRAAMLEELRLQSRLLRGMDNGGTTILGGGGRSANDIALQAAR